MADRHYKSILIAVVDRLKQQGLEGASTLDGLNAWQALQEVVTQANMVAIPLAEIELGGFDLDQLLQQPKTPA